MQAVLVLTTKFQEDGEIEEVPDGAADTDAHSLVPNKVHIRGLDQLDEAQLKSYLSNHIGSQGAYRIEWVNDSSANLVFSSDAAAQEALTALSAVEIADATQLTPSDVLPAKPFADKPDVALQVRIAVESDKKERGAAQKSRFYLFHPEWDPETEEGRRRREGRDRRYRERDDRGAAYRRSGRGRYDERFQDEEPDTFDVNLYDDDAGSLAKRARPSSRRGPGRRRDSSSPSNRSDGYRSANRDKELFPNSRQKDPLRSERGTYHRNRSASPTRDDRDAMESDLAKDREAVRSNREKARSIKDRIYTKGGDRGNAGGVKELFPTSGKKELFPTGGKKELFPTGGKKELFPNKSGGNGMAQMDSVLDGMACLSYDGAVDFSDERSPFSSSSPISTPPSSGLRQSKACRHNGRWTVIVTPTDRITDSKSGGMLSIRGTAGQNSGMMTIKGTAQSVKELFPNKFNDNGANSANVGRELFADKLENRARRRQRAEDLFH